LGCHPVTDDIVCSAILLLVGRRPVNISVASDTSLEIMINADASALAVPAIVQFVHRSHDSDPNDRNRILSKTDVCFRQKLSVGSVEGRRQDKAGFPASGTSFLSVCLHIVLGRPPTFRRDQRAALFPIIILFQRSESRRPR
jgi:hypothetical protein